MDRSADGALASICQCLGLIKVYLLAKSQRYKIKTKLHFEGRGP